MNIYIDKRNDLTEQIISYAQTLTNESCHEQQKDCFVYKLADTDNLNGISVIFYEKSNGISVIFYESENKVEYNSVFTNYPMLI